MQPDVSCLLAFSMQGGDVAGLEQQSLMAGSTLQWVVRGRF